MNEVRPKKRERSSPHAHHWPLDPEWIFLNHGSFGACPRPVLAAQRHWRERLEAQPVRFMVKDLEPALDAAREVLASFVGAHADDLVFVTNATMGINWVMRGLALGPGDEVVVSDHEYNATTNTVRAAAERAGATVRVAHVPFPLTGPDEVVAAFERALTEKTRLVVADHVTSATGLVLPIERIVALASERGIETLVDGAHAPGMLPLALDRLGAAYYTGNCHKWLCTPKGSAFLHVRRDLQASTPPLIVSHGRNSARTDRSRFRLEADFVGTCDPSPWLVIPDAISFLENLMPGGFHELRAHNHALVSEARARFEELLHVPPPAPLAMLGSLASIPLPPRAPDEAAPSLPGVDPLWDWFGERRIEIVVTPFGAPGNRLLRVSGQVYNAADEYAAAADALEIWLAERREARAGSRS